MAGVFDHLHIKKNTAGSSNELSFDVLEAASSGLDEKQARPKAPALSPKPSQGSYTGVAGAAPVTQEEEINKRKKARRTHAVRLWAFSILAAAAVVAAVAWFGMGYVNQSQQFSEKFDALVARLAEEDELLAEVDSLMGSAPDDDNAAARSEVLSKAQVSKGNLQEVVKNVTTLQYGASTSQDEVALNQIELSATGRIEMLDIAEETFRLAVNRGSLGKTAEGIWNEVIKADQIAKTAANDANKAATEDDTKKAREETQQALDKMGKALEELQALSKKNPDLDLTVQEKYVETRIKSLRYAVETGDALLQGNKELAAEKNDQYNAADKEAAEIASTLPLSAAKTIDDAFEAEMASCLEKYDAARQKVISADSHVREYLSSR